MISRKPLGDRNDNPSSQQKDGGLSSPQPKKEQSHLDPKGRLFSVDSGFVSPETICRPKLSASRRSSPANANKPFSSFRLEDSPEQCHVAENELPSKAIADLWNKPLKNSDNLGTKGTLNARFGSGGSNTPNRWGNDLPPMKLSFDSCESSADEGSPAPGPLPSFQRKGVGYRRSLSYSEGEGSGSKKESFRLLHAEGTPVCNPKRHKFENDENSPYKAYLEPLRSTPATATSVSNANDHLSKPKSGEGTALENLADRSSSLTPEVKRLCFARSQSESAIISSTSCSIKTALERIESNPCLIGDGSKSYILPFTMNGKHPDLKEITGETLVELMGGGKIGESISSFKVIDCRYPYEYDGGHIKGAINLYTRRQVYDELMQPKMLGAKEASSEQRNILIFHCEFSSQRGPDMCRFLRDSDRETNAATYPNLYYPELYVLFGGYKAFFEHFSALCEPQTYMPMDHPTYSEDCRRFKSQTKLEHPVTVGNRLKKGKSQKYGRIGSFAKKCNF